MVSLPLTLAGIALWSLVIYVGFWEASHRLVNGVVAWANKENAAFSEITQAAAAVVSLLPPLLAGWLLFFLLVNTLSLSWALTLGFMTAVGTGIYQLGRVNGQEERSRKP